MIDTVCPVVDGGIDPHERSFGSDKGSIGVSVHDERHDAWHFRSIVLDEPFHLSYPYVFDHESETYMIPEAKGSNSVRLYRATFSLTPPTARTRPRSVISPVMATSVRDGVPVRAEISAVAIVIPADGPSFGVAPSGI